VIGQRLPTCRELGEIGNEHLPHRCVCEPAPRWNPCPRCGERHAARWPRPNACFACAASVPRLRALLVAFRIWFFSRLPNGRRADPDSLAAARRTLGES
jgi:hypothetical protein